MIWSSSRDHAVRGGRRLRSRAEGGTTGISRDAPEAVRGSFLCETYNHNKLRPVELRPWYVLPCNLLTTPRLNWVRYTGARRVPDACTLLKPVTHKQPPQTEVRYTGARGALSVSCSFPFKRLSVTISTTNGDGCSCSDRRRRGKVGGSAGRPTRLSAPCHIRDRYHRVGPHTPDWVSVGRCRRDNALASTVQYGGRRQSVRLR